MTRNSSKSSTSKRVSAKDTIGIIDIKDRKSIMHAIGIMIAAWAPVFLVAGIFEYLGKKRMGFMRFLVYIKHEYSESLLSQTSLSILIACIAVGTIVAFLNLQKRRKNAHYLNVCLFIMQIVTIAFISSEYFVTLKSSPFILLACICSIFIQWCVICYKNFIKF